VSLVSFFVTVIGKMLQIIWNI